MSINDGSLQLYLKFDAIEDRKVIDSSGNKIEPTVHGNPQVIDADWIGKSLKFDGENDYIKIPDSDAINFETHQDFTVETWVKIASQQKFQKYGDNDIIEKWSQLSAKYPYVIRYLRGKRKIVAARYDGSHNPSVETKSKLNFDQFYHVAFVKNGQNLYLYLNGKREGSAIDTVQNDTKNSSPLYLARRGSKKYANFFTGELAYLHIYNRALSQQEIKRDIALSIAPILQDNFNELRSLKATWERVKQGIGDLNSTDRPDIPEDIKNILGILGEADITRQILIFSTQVDGNRDRAEQAAKYAKQFDNQAQESALKASELAPGSVEAQAARESASQAKNAAEQAQFQAEQASTEAKHIETLVHQLVTSSNETPTPINEESPAQPAVIETGETTPETITDSEVDRANIVEQARQYADNSQQAQEEALKWQNIAQQKALEAAQYARKAGEYYDNWETIGDIFGFSESTDNGNVVDAPNLQQPEPEKALPKHDNWQVISDLFGLTS